MHSDVDQEQTYFDRALELRERLETNVGAARQDCDRETARNLRRRVGALGVVDPGIAVAFGRIDANGQRWYIGKSAIWDEDNELVVVNWQAPVAAPFYRATPEEPEGLEARRIFRCEPGNRIRDIDEQVFSGLEAAVRSGVPPVRSNRPEIHEDHPVAHTSQSAGRPAPREVAAVERQRPQAAPPPSEERPVPRRAAPPARRQTAPSSRRAVEPSPSHGDDMGGFGAGAAGTRYEERYEDGPDSYDVPSKVSHTVEVFRSTGTGEYVRETGSIEVVRLSENGNGQGATAPRAAQAPATPAVGTETVHADVRSSAGPSDRRVEGQLDERADERRPERRPEPRRNGPRDERPEHPQEQQPLPASRQPGRQLATWDEPAPQRVPERAPLGASSAPPPAPVEPSASPARRDPRTGPAGAEPPVRRESVGPDMSPPAAPQEAPATPARAHQVSDVLLDELERARSGELSDIVATIQSAQYEIITRDVDQLLVVQGGPGTGKTVVGLHRVSWVLYNRRDAWQPNDVLVVGPNDAFVRYISSVLPSLGDDAVVQLPVGGLGPRVEVTRPDPVELRCLKGDRRMQRLLLRAMRNRQKPQRGPVELTVAGRTVRLDGDGVVAQARHLAGQPHNEARRALRAYLIDEVQTFFHRRGLRGVAAIGDMAESESVRGIDDYLERIWPAMTPQKFLVDMFSKRRRLEAAGVGLLTGDEIDMLLISPDTRVEDATWSIDDIALLDLADSLLNGTPVTYEHIVVDEAQDLTPMQFESIRRRSRTGSMTIVGDLAQGTTPWSPDSWEEAVLHLRRDRVPTEIAELTIGYRLPQEIHDVAMRLLPEIAPRLREPEPVRATGDPVEVLARHPEDLMEGVVEAVRSRVGTGLIGVIVPQRDHAAVGVALDRAGFYWADQLTTDGPKIVVISADEGRGLEFDHVVVVEPTGIAGESPRGLRALFVALTRTTGSLALVHSEALPPALELDSPVPAEPRRRPEPVPVAPPAPPGPAYGSAGGDEPYRGHREEQNGSHTLGLTMYGRSANGADPGGYGVNGGYDDNGVNGRYDSGAPSSNGHQFHGASDEGPVNADPWAPMPRHESEGRSALVAHQPGEQVERYEGHANGTGPDAPNAMERAMARAIAGELADALGRYITPALAPLVLEEMRHALAERLPPGSEILPAGGGALGLGGEPPPAGETVDSDQVLDVRR